MGTGGSAAVAAVRPAPLRAPTSRNKVGQRPSGPAAMRGSAGAPS